MRDAPGFAVFFFPPALEALGDAIKPYLQDGPAGPHIPCRAVDTAGAFIELTLQGETPEGRPVEVMVPANMVRMIISVRSDTDFGFYNRNRPMVEPGMRGYVLPAPAIEAPAPDAAGAAAGKPVEPPAIAADSPDARDP